MLYVIYIILCGIHYILKSIQKYITHYILYFIYYLLYVILKKKMLYTICHISYKLCTICYTLYIIYYIYYMFYIICYIYIFIYQIILCVYLFVSFVQRRQFSVSSAAIIPCHGAQVGGQCAGPRSNQILRFNGHRERNPQFLEGQGGGGNPKCVFLVRNPAWVELV